MSTPAGLGWLRRLTQRGMLHEPEEDDERWHVFVSPIGLTPWMWMGIRGEAYAIFLAILVIMGGLFHLFWAAAGVSFMWLLLAKWFSRQHPYWPELFMRLVFQPIGWRDT